MVFFHYLHHLLPREVLHEIEIPDGFFVWFPCQAHIGNVTGQNGEGAAGEWRMKSDGISAGNMKSSCLGSARCGRRSLTYMRKAETLTQSLIGSHQNLAPLSRRPSACR